MPEQYQIILLSFAYGIITLFSISGNSSIIYIVIRNRRMHSVTNYFICNLALADCFVACFAVPFQVLKMLFTVVALFLICWFPLQLYNFLNAKFNREFRKLYSCLPRIYSNKIDGKLTDVPLLYQVQLRQVTCQQYSPNPSSQPSSRQNTTISINSIPFNTQSSSISITSNIKGKKEAVFLLKSQVDVNQVGTIGRNQFQQWVHAGVGSTGQSSEGGVTAVTFLMLMLILILALMLQQLVKVLVSTLTPIQILFVDQAAGGIQTYTQNIKVRFLQTPLIPSPGPPILHERPPQPPVAQTSQIVIRNLPASPEPPRSVIIERISATPYQP
ncbi:unnamed protein product, partial [Rotaria magnacalcarata]